MDVDGLCILHAFRASGVPAVSMLMDLDTYQAYARFGTNTNKHGQPIKTTAARSDRRRYDGEK